MDLEILQRQEKVILMCEQQKVSNIILFLINFNIFLLYTISVKNGNIWYNINREEISKEMIHPFPFRFAITVFEKRFWMKLFHNLQPNIKIDLLKGVNKMILG